jgi:hypothetical protein
VRPASLRGIAVQENFLDVTFNVTDTQLERLDLLHPIEMLSQGIHKEYLRRLAPPPCLEALQEKIDRMHAASSSGLPELKSLSPRQGQEFLNYMGSRLRTAAKKFHTTRFDSENARVAFEKKMGTEFVSGLLHSWLILNFDLEQDNALHLLAILVCSGKHYVAPKYLTLCIKIEGDQAYKIGTGFELEDGLTVLLSDSDEDWWVNGKNPPSNVHLLLRAWRRFQSLVSHLSVIW